MITQVRYEDVATKPYEVTEKLFDFLILDYPPEMDNHIATHTGITKNHKINPIPKRGEGYNSNSAKNAYLWRSQFKKSEIDRVEASCKVVLEKLGYAKFENILANSDVLQKKFHEVFLE